MDLREVNGTQLSLVYASIADTRTDVIVNTVSRDFNFKTSAVSRALLDKAGPVLQSECRVRCPNGIRRTEVVDTVGGNLNCSKVYHCSPRTWWEGEVECERELRLLIDRCLGQASNQGMKSIAFPAMSTGAAGVPRQVVANAMFEQIELFCKNNPNPTLEYISIVLHPTDQESIKVFEEHMMSTIESKVVSATPVPEKIPKRQIGRSSSMPIPERPERALLKRPESYVPIPERHMQEMDLGRSSPVPEMHQLDTSAMPGQYTGKILVIENINLQVKQGDLTNEDTDAIVHATSAEFGCTTGDVSEAVFRIGGPALRAECAELKKMKDGVAVTGAGGLRCRHVIHVVSPQKQDDWSKQIKKALKKAEKHKITSVSFPALGTGAMKISAAAMSGIMVDVIFNHAHSKHNKTLRDIYICVFDEAMTEDFQYALRKAALVGKGFLLPSRAITESQRVDFAGAIPPTFEQDTANEPPTWTQMSDDESLEVIELNQSSLEYRAVRDKVPFRMNDCIIVQIHRIQNRKIHNIYLAHKKNMKNPNERILWHGTSREAVDGINIQGFDRQRHGKNATRYGKGTYFAKSAEYSIHYATADGAGLRCMYQCKVLTGEYTEGNPDMIALPPKNPMDPKEKHVLYDSLVNNVNNPGIFVIFQDHQAYPEYLITFKDITSG